MTDEFAYWWLSAYPEIDRTGTIYTLQPTVSEPAGKPREFPIGFHVAAPGPGKPEKQIVRVKAIGVKTA